MFPPLPSTKARSLAKALLTWFRDHARDLPWRRTRDPYAIWISEIMLQQTQVKTVIPYWKRWMRELPTVEALAAARMERVLKLWEGLGYYTRARNLHRAAQVIVAFHELPQRFGADKDQKAIFVRPKSLGIPSAGFMDREQVCKEHGAPVPRHFDSLLALPGVGRYTAGAICSIAFNQPKPILDGNVMRVLTRLFGIGAMVREKAVNECLWQIAQQLVVAASQLPDPEQTNCSHLNQSLMELGATICTPRQPGCSACPLRRRCLAFQEGRQEDLPNLGKRAAATAREFHAFIIERQGRLLLQQRPNGVVNAGLWEFPNAEAASWRAAAEALHLPIATAQPLGEVRHSITRYRITLYAWRVSLEPGVRFPRRTGRWLGLVKADALAFAAAHRRIMDRLLT